MARTKHTASSSHHHPQTSNKVAMKHATKQPKKKFAQKAARKTAPYPGNAQAVAPPPQLVKRVIRFRPGTVALR